MLKKNGLSTSLIALMALTCVAGQSPRKQLEELPKLMEETNHAQVSQQEQKEEERKSAAKRSMEESGPVARKSAAKRAVEEELAR